MLVEQYKISLEDARKVAKIKDEDYQMEILEVMEEYKMDFESAKRFLS